MKTLHASTSFMLRSLHCERQFTFLSIRVFLNPYLLLQSPLLLSKILWLELTTLLKSITFNLFKRSGISNEFINHLFNSFFGVESTPRFLNGTVDGWVPDRQLPLDAMWGVWCGHCDPTATYVYHLLTVSLTLPFGRQTLKTCTR